jgi:hypothetical protein
MQFLRDKLSAGPLPTSELEEEAQAQGISKAAFKRARKKLGIKATKKKGAIDAPWLLELPAEITIGHCNRDAKDPANDSEVET